VIRFIVGEGEAEQRLDMALSALVGISRSQAQRWIDAGRVRVNADGGRAGQRLRLGDRLEASAPEPLPAALEPEAIPLAILHEDADLIVVDKPAGLVVHPAPGHARGTLVHALLHHCRELAGVGGVLRPGIVHRLDRGTSGVLVAAKSDAAHQSLAEQFRDHTIERRYLAFVRGLPGSDAGRVERAIGRHRSDRKRMSVRSRAGRDALTDWRVLRRFARAACSLLEVAPATGRTHQIRVHLASAGLPILGDPVYGRGGGRPAAGRAALHAARLSFRHPRSGEPLRFEAPLPPDLRALLAELEAGEAGR